MADDRRTVARDEAERCAMAMKLMAGNELRFSPALMSGPELALFLIELEKKCLELGIASTIGFIFQPSIREAAELKREDQPDSAQGTQAKPVPEPLGGKALRPGAAVH